MIYLPEDQEQLFSQLDANGDGDISSDEAQANDRLAKQFDELDTFQNQRITRSEFSAFEVQDPASQSGSPQEAESSHRSSGN